MKRIFLVFFIVLLTSLANAESIKISELPENVTPTIDDLLITVDNPAASPITQKATIANVISALVPPLLDCPDSSGQHLNYALSTNSFVCGDSSNLTNVPATYGNATWGTGSGFVWTFNAGATDPVMTLSSGSIDLSDTSLTVHGSSSQITFANNIFINGDTSRKLKLSSTGGTFNEDLFIDNDSTTNTIALSSTTGVTNIHTGASIGLINTATNNSLGDLQLTGSTQLTADIPTAQTITAAGTITANACGSVKLISSAGSVTTSTSNTFTAPAAGNEGCIMHVCNSGSNNITLDNNSNFKSAAGGDIVVTADDCILVGSTGASGVWYQLSALEAN